MSVEDAAERGRAWAARVGRDDPRVRWVCFAYTKVLTAYDADATSAQHLYEVFAELRRHLAATDLGPAATRSEMAGYASGVRDYFRDADAALTPTPRDGPRQTRD